MFAIIGLGNPGKQYELTRHNAGFWVVEALARELGGSWQSKGAVEYAQASLEEEKVYLIKPQSFMNLSGEAAKPFLSFYKIQPSKILVVHDELDLRPGRLQLRRGGSSGGHRGLNDLFQHLGQRDFYRLRLGIGHPRELAKAPIKVEDWVLGRPGREEQLLLEEAVSKSAEAIRVLVHEGLELAQQKYN